MGRFDCEHSMRALIVPLVEHFYVRGLDVHGNLSPEALFAGNYSGTEMLFSFGKRVFATVAAVATGATAVGGVRRRRGHRTPSRKTCYLVQSIGGPARHFYWESD